MKDRPKIEANLANTQIISSSNTKVYENFD